MSKAQTIANLVLEDKINNSVYNDEYFENCKTVDYDAIHKELPKLITSPQDLEGEEKGTKVKAIVKLAITGAFQSQFSNPGKSHENYEMIDQIYEATKTDKDFWEKPEESLSPEELKDLDKKYLHNVTKDPAISLVAKRMCHEYFGFGDKELTEKAMEAALKLSQKLRQFPAFTKEFSKSSDFFSFSESYKQMLEKTEGKPIERAQAENSISTVANAIVKKDIKALARRQNGYFIPNLEDEIKKVLFTGKTEDTKFSEIIAVAEKSLTPKPTPKKANDPGMDMA